MQNSQKDGTSLEIRYKNSTIQVPVSIEECKCESGFGLVYDSCKKRNLCSTVCGYIPPRGFYEWENPSSCF